MPSSPPAALANLSPRARRALGLFLALGGASLAARHLASRLLRLILYHPCRYGELPDHAGTVARFFDALGRIDYELEEVRYALPPHGLLGQLRATLRAALRGPAAAAAAAPPQLAFLARPKGLGVGGLWLVHGGNAMVSTDWFPFWWQLLSALPAGAERPAVLFLDYPGYGANAGDPAPATVLGSQFAALRAVLPRLHPPGAGGACGGACRVHVLGHSLGAAAGAQLAASWRQGKLGDALAAAEPGQLVLSAPFLSVAAMAQAIFGRTLLPSWLLQLLVAQQWDNGVWVPKAADNDWKVSIIHGTSDEICPFWMGRALRDAVLARDKSCAYAEVKGAGHNDLTTRTGQYAALMGLRASGI